MNRVARAISWGLLWLFFSSVPSSARLSAQADRKTVIRLALLAPRTTVAGVDHLEWSRRLAAATNGRVELRVYYGGIAGSDNIVLNKMRLGQMDAAGMDIGVLRYFMRQALVMMAPYTFENYRQLDAVYKELGPSFDQEAYRNGFKVITWYDVGAYRIFSKQPIRNFADIRRARPWLYKESPFLYDFYKTIGATGVPLDVSELFMGLQNGMVDMIWISPIVAVLFGLNNYLKYMSSASIGFLIGALVMRAPVWDVLNENDKEAFARPAREIWRRYQAAMRETDWRVYTLLKRRGIRAVDFVEADQGRSIAKRLREKMVGRLYTKSLLEHVEKICAQYSSSK